MGKEGHDQQRGQAPQCHSGKSRLYLNFGITKISNDVNHMNYTFADYSKCLKQHSSRRSIIILPPLTAWDSVLWADHTRLMCINCPSLIFEWETPPCYHFQHS